MKTILLGFTFAIASLSAVAQIQTLVVTPTNINSATITVSSNSFAVVKSVDYDAGGLLLINVHGVTFTNDFSYQTADGLTIAGPATIQLQAHCCAYYASYATIDVEPGPFPPGKTLTVGAYSGNVQVTMQMSTDLVNWTTAVNGMVYTNSPDARFFRIQLITNAQAP